MTLLKIDELVISDHSYITPDDTCYYLLNYMPHKGFGGGDTNSLILNFKKSLARRDLADFPYKYIAITKIAGYIKSYVLPRVNIANTILVPIPPSKNKQHEFYDNRMTTALRLACQGSNWDVRELINTIESTEAVHESANRPSIEDLQNNYSIDNSLITNPKPRILLFDDVLTTGAHYVACKNKLRSVFPDCLVAGVFIARRELPAANNDWIFDFDDSDLDLPF